MFFGRLFEPLQILLLYMYQTFPGRFFGFFGLNSSGKIDEEFYLLSAFNPHVRISVSKHILGE